MKLAFALFACALVASAAGIDGQWNAELSARGKKAAAAAPAQNSSFTLNLTSQDGQVKGTIGMAGKKKAREQRIQNAKLNGNHLTFKTVQTGKKDTVTFTWDVTVNGDQMTGTRTREGARRGASFKARKSG